MTNNYFINYISIFNLGEEWVNFHFKKKHSSFTIVFFLFSLTAFSNLLCGIINTSHLTYTCYLSVSGSMF